MTTLIKAYPKIGRAGSWQPNLVVDKIRIRRNLCQESFWDFCHEFWEEVVSDVPVWNWHMRIIAQELQKVSERVFRWQPKKYDLLINVPPGSTKSTFASILLLPWQWSRAPWMRFLNFTFENDLSMEFGTKARNVIRSDLYQETFGPGSGIGTKREIMISPEQDTKLYFANTLKGERRGTSVKGGITGRHAHFQCGDDVIDPEGEQSEAELGTANKFCTETLPSRVVNKRIVPLAMIGQRLGLEDPYGQLLARCKAGGTPVRHICLPADIRSGQKVVPRIYKKKYKKGLLNPKRHSWKALKAYKSEMTIYAYAGQFDQSPTPLTGGMFQVDKFVEDEHVPRPSDFLAVVRWWDKAASTEKWGNFTSGVLMGILKDPDQVPRYWVLDQVKGKWTGAAREKMIQRQARMDEVLYKAVYTIGMEQEGGSGGKDSVEDSVRRLSGHRAVFERATGDKIARADAFATQVGARNVGLAPGAWVKNFKEALKYFGPGCKDKDTADSSSGAFKFLNKKRHRAGGLW